MGRRAADLSPRGETRIAAVVSRNARRVVMEQLLPGATTGVGGSGSCGSPHLPWDRGPASSTDLGSATRAAPGPQRAEPDDAPAMQRSTSRPGFDQVRLSWMYGNMKARARRMPRPSAIVSVQAP